MSESEAVRRPAPRAEASFEHGMPAHLTTSDILPTRTKPW